MIEQPVRATSTRGVSTRPGKGAWLLLACAIAVEVGASLALQAAVTQPWWYSAVVAGYGASFALLVRILRSGMAVGVAYGIWGASGVALTAVLSAVVFDQGLSIANVCGIGLIVVGVLLVEVGSQASGQAAHGGGRS